MNKDKKVALNKVNIARNNNTKTLRIINYIYIIRIMRLTSI